MNWWVSFFRRYKFTDNTVQSQKTLITRYKCQKTSSHGTVWIFTDLTVHFEFSLIGRYFFELGKIANLSKIFKFDSLIYIIMSRPFNWIRWELITAWYTEIGDSAVILIKRFSCNPNQEAESSCPPVSRFGI